MLNVGPGELLVIFLVALIVLGPNKLPEAARQVGRITAELRRLSSGFQDEMREAMREPTPTLPPLPTAESNGAAPKSPTSTTARRRREPLRASEATSAEQQLSD
ncbi:MAG: sec-independent protein translocase protein TatB [Actinomycetota bacterium]|nr:sec-independent protein translocase protein TatB [Actinomycetota bacterium]